MALGAEVFVVDTAAVGAAVEAGGGFKLGEDIGAGDDAGIGEEGFGAPTDLGLIRPEEAAAAFEVEIELTHGEEFGFEGLEERKVVLGPEDEEIAGESPVFAAEGGPPADEFRGERWVTGGEELAEGGGLEFAGVFEALELPQDGLAELELSELEELEMGEAFGGGEVGGGDGGAGAGEEGELAGIVGNGELAFEAPEGGEESGGGELFEGCEVVSDIGFQCVGKLECTGFGEAGVQTDECGQLVGFGGAWWVGEGEEGLVDFVGLAPGADEFGEFAKESGSGVGGCGRVRGGWGV
jgi:hypothetical protein